MRRHDNLIIIAPHTTCGFNADTVCFLRCDFSCLKALITVIRNIAAELAETSLGGHHLLIGSLLRTVDSADIHRLICLVAVLNVIESGSSVVVKIFALDCFIGILSVIDNIF